MLNYDDNDLDYMRKMNMPAEHSPMMAMPHEQLESMYPRCYHIINPEVERCCGMMYMQHGPMYMPNRQEVDRMVEEIDNRVGAEIDAEYSDNCEGENRQFGYGGRRRRSRDLIRILLLRRLLGRRRRPHFGGGYGWYPY